MPGCELLLFDSVAGRCRACGEPLPRTRRSWCSLECQLVYERNHYWDAARDAAVTRDKRCVKCGWVADQDYATSYGQYFMWSRKVLQGRGADNWLEVNHIVPRYGAGYGTGCWNHLSNLETLCHRDHVKVTGQQRVARARALAS